MEKRKPVIYAIRGYKNSGKTTMVTRLVSLLSGKGYRVAVIKHDGHDFEPDVPGTDSYRAWKAGAYGTAVFSENRVLIHKEFKDPEKLPGVKTPGIDEKQIMEAFPEADIILIEGLKNSSYPGYFCKYPGEPLADPEKIAGEIIGMLDHRPKRARV